MQQNPGPYCLTVPAYIDAVVCETLQAMGSHHDILGCEIRV